MSLNKMEENTNENKRKRANLAEKKIGARGAKNKKKKQYTREISHNKIKVPST